MWASTRPRRACTSATSCRSLTARRLQLAGHRPLLLVGGATGQIGDPKESAERTLNPPEVVAGWVRADPRPARAVRLVHRGATRRQLVNNLDWTGEMSVVEFLRDVGKHFPVNKMLAREVVRARLETGISFTEFSYQLLQANDFFELHRRHGCQLQFGGSDQWGNITAGVDYVRRRGRRPGAGVHHPAGHQGRRHQVRQDRGRRGLARPGDDQPVRVLPVLGQRRRPGRRPLPAVLQLPLPGGDGGAGEGDRGAAGGAAGPAGARRGADHAGARGAGDGARRSPPARRSSAGGRWTSWPRRRCGPR